MHNGFSVSSRVDGGVPPGIDADQLSSVSGRSSEKMLFLEEGHIIYLPTAVNDTELLHTDGGNVQFESEDVENDRSGGLPPQIDDEQLEDWMQLPNVLTDQYWKRIKDKEKFTL